MLAFGGNVSLTPQLVKLQPLDSLRQPVHISPYGLWLTLDASAFESVEVNQHTNQIRVGLARQTPDTALAVLRIEQPAKLAGVGAYHPQPAIAKERDAYVIRFKPATSWIELTDRLG